MSIRKSYLHKSLRNYPEEAGISLHLIDLALASYKKNSERSFVILSIFILFVLFTLVQSFLSFVLSKEVFTIFSSETTFIVQLMKFIVSYIAEYGFILAVLFISVTLLTLFQNTKQLHQYE